MTLRGKYLAGCAALALATTMSASAYAVDPSRLLTADTNPNDWLTNHGSYKSYHYSPADQINAGNVKNLEVAWTHFPSRATRGIQSTPLAAAPSATMAHPVRYFPRNVIWSPPSCSDDSRACRTD